MRALRWLRARVHLTAIAAAGVTGLGALTSANAVAALPPRFAHLGPYLTLLGLVLQAYTHKVTRAPAAP